MKILFSPRYGAGWSTWIGENKEEKIFALTYEPLIEAIANIDDEQFDRALEQFEIDYEERFGKKPTTIGAAELTIVEVDYPFKIEEYDGFETIIPMRDVLWYDPMGDDLV